MSLIVDLSPEIEASLTERAQAEGKPLLEYVQNALEALVTPKEFDLKAFRALPREEQRRQLRAQAEDAAPMYEADLALPVHERELTAFSALDDDPFYEYPEDDNADNRTETR